MAYNERLTPTNAQPANIENDYSPWVELVDNIEETLEALLPLLHRPRLAAESIALLQLIAEDRKRLMDKAAAKSGVPIHPVRLISELQKILTPDVTARSESMASSMRSAHELLRVSETISTAN